MPNRTRAQIQTDINTKLATNGSGAITALKLREVVTDIIDSSPIKLDEPKADSTHTHVATAISDSTAAGRAILTAADSSAQRTSLGLGTSAVLNVPASGNAASGEVVKGNDTRLTDTRTPSAHTHPSTDISDSTVAGRALLTGASASAQRTSLGLGTGATLDVPASGDASASQLVKGNDSRLGGSGGGWSKTVVEIASEFVENVPPAAGWTQSTSGTGAATAALETDQTAIGVHQLSTGTTATGRAGFFRSSLSIRFGGGEVLFKHRVRVNQLSDGTNRFIIRVGTGDNASGDNADGIYFEYDDTASANWRCVTATNSIRTKDASSVAVSASTWVWLEATVNAAGTSVDFLIDGSVVDTITTNIPTASGRVSGENMHIIKSIGTTACTFDIDRSYVKLTT